MARYSFWLMSAHLSPRLPGPIPATGTKSTNHSSLALVNLLLTITIQVLPVRYMPFWAYKIVLSVFRVPLKYLLRRLLTNTELAWRVALHMPWPCLELPPSPHQIDGLPRFHLECLVQKTRQLRDEWALACRLRPQCTIILAPPCTSHRPSHPSGNPSVCAPYSSTHRDGRPIAALFYPAAPSPGACHRAKNLRSTCPGVWLLMRPILSVP